MGNFRLVIDMVGGHGCCREKKDGEKVYGCGQMSCPDCRIQEFVNDLATRYDVKKAELIHWPGEAGEIVDTIVPTKKEIAKYRDMHGVSEPYINHQPGHRVRKGNFNG